MCGSQNQYQLISSRVTRFPRVEALAALGELEERHISSKKMMGAAVQFLADLVVAGISLTIGLGIFAFIASVLCSAAFLINVKDIS